MSCLLAAVTQNNLKGEAHLWWLRLLHILEGALECSTSTIDISVLDT